MREYLTERIRRSRRLVTYILLTYVDKALSFVLPLSFLFIIGDSNMYTFVEVAFSYAALVMIVLELGMSNYLFYGYRNAADKEVYLTEAKDSFSFMLCFYCLASGAGVLLLNSLSAANLALFIVVALRSMFTLYVNFNTNICRLKERPSAIYLTTITVNVLSILVLLTSFRWMPAHALFFFFLPSAAVLFYVCLRFLLRRLRHFRLSTFSRFVSGAFRFSWPIMLNVLAMSFINNYAKIYSFYKLSEHDTAIISYVMRVALLIQLTHAAFTSYYSKSLYMDTRKRINPVNLLRYTFLMIVTTLLASVVLVFSARFASVGDIDFDATTAAFIAYTVIWCYIGYLELYFGVMNANRMVLVFSLFSAALYVLLLAVSEDVTMFRLALYMLLSAIVNLSLVIHGLARLKVIRTS